MTARNGVTAALLVQSGWSGVDDVFSGADNFLWPSAEGRSGGLIESSASATKSCARTSRSGRWVADSGAARRAGEPAEETSLRDGAGEAGHRALATDEASVVNNRDMPDICLQHMVAVMIIDKTASFNAAHDKARMQDPAVLRERAKVQLVPTRSSKSCCPSAWPSSRSR